MMQRRLLCLALLLVVGLAGCAQQPASPATSSAVVASAAQPGWISQHPERSGFVYGVASAEIYGSEANALERAREQARVDLLGRIRVAVGGSVEARSRMEMRNDQVTDLTEVLTQQASSRVEEVELPGIEVTETWVSPNGKDAWALARLNRAEAEQQLLTNLSLTNQRLLDRGLPRTGSNLDKVRQVLPSLPDLSQRDQLHHQLEFLAASERIDSAQRQEVDQLAAAIQSLLAGLSFQVEGQNNLAQRMAPELAQQLTRMGFNMVEGNADLNLRLSLNMDEVVRNNLHHRVAQASGQVLTPEGRTLYAISESGRATSTDANVATRNAIDEMAKSLARRLAAGLYDNL